VRIRKLRWRRYAGRVVFAVVIVGCGKHDARSSASAKAAASIDTTVGHAPPGVRIKVEVLNASKNRGAARRATLLLRDRGYDVVAMGTTRKTQTATVVLDRSGHPEWAQLITRAIGGKAAERPDTSRYLDATVVLGSDWTAPPMPFYP
jgi:LytR cell envelope-related transcriptional attenuator